MFRVGDKVGLYEIVAKLRAGGMATLFLGRRAGAAGFAKLVAIKVVHEHLAEDPDFVQMFVDEALLSARIQHPNVVHVEELREFEGHHFLVMEFVQGCSLGQLLVALVRRKRRLSPELAIHIAIKIADGLHAAHETRDDNGEPLGVVHRDVSPQNILLSYQGNVKLIDFGIAKARGRAQSTSGGIKGKFRYMSPEHAFGRELDRRGDIYSLAIVLFEMLTMRRRFAASSQLSLLEVVRHPDVVPPSRHAVDLPAGLDDVVLKAMAKAPEDRFPTARALRDALVDVNPRAASLHESALGSLLTLVMADKIIEDLQQLPSNISGVTLDLPRAGASVSGVLETMTISVEDVELNVSDSGSMDSLGTHGAATSILPGEGQSEEATVFDPSCVDQMEAHAAEARPETPGPTGPPTDPAPPPEHLHSQRDQPTMKLALEEPSARPTRLVGGAVGLLVATLGLSFVLLFLWTRDPAEPEVTSTGETPAMVSAEPPSALPVAPPAMDAGGQNTTLSSDAGAAAPLTVTPVQRPVARRRRRRRRGRASRRTGRRRTGRGRPVADEW